VQTLGYAGFVPQQLEAVLEKRRRSAGDAVREYLNTEHIDVPDDAADVQLAETFLHHRVIAVPVVDADRRVAGLVLRADFFRVLAERYLAT
jgi:CBS-domain-containing membrane protein